MTATTRLPDGATRDALGPTLIRLQEQGVADIMVADADLGKSTSARKFGDVFPERFITFGVAEQNMVSAAAGMASMGQTVVASTFAVFIEHAFDQLRMSIAQPNLNVKIFASHSGVSAGEDGASAQSVEDVALFSSLVNFTVCAPADLQEAEAMVEAAIRTPGPFYIRTSRPKTPALYPDGSHFELGRAHMLRQGSDVTLIAYGLMVERAVRAAETLAAEGIEARVLNMSTIRPLDTAALQAAAAETGAIVVAEEHLAHSGLGSMCAQALAQTVPVPMEFVAVDDRYGESGKWFEVLEMVGLTPDAIAAAARKVVGRKG